MGEEKDEEATTGDSSSPEEIKESGSIPPSTDADTSKTPPPSTSSSFDTAAADQIRITNWQGSVPILLTLAPTSLSSTTVPSPIHVLVSRQTFLHVGLENAVRRLHEYAPPSFSFGFGKKVLQVEEPDNTTAALSESKDDENEKQQDSATGEDEDEEKDSNTSDNDNKGTSTDAKPPEPYPVCWFEDENTNQPLKWQCFVGVLFDSIGNHSKTTDGSSPLPWKIRLHFNSYPTQTLLELDPVSGVLTNVERTFKNSLKQALVLVHGNSKVALNLTKQSHQSIWQAIQQPSSVNYNNLYKPILLQEIQPKDDSDILMIPIRLSLDSMTKPMIQKRWDNVAHGAANDKEGEASDHDNNKSSEQTLGRLLCEWAPQHFEQSPSKEDEGPPSYQPMNSSTTTCYISGVTPPLSTPLLELWRTLSQPDNFLYIVVRVGDGEETETKE